MRVVDVNGKRNIPLGQSAKSVRAFVAGTMCYSGRERENAEDEVEIYGEDFYGVVVVFYCLVERLLGRGKRRCDCFWDFFLFLFCLEEGLGEVLFGYSD